jgi:hypothetical protein
MSDDQLPAVTRQKLAVPGRSRRNAVTGKLKAALEAMVWEGLERKAAAAQAGLKDRSVRDALHKPHVVGFYTAELTALRTSKRARNIHTLASIADDSDNDMARVSAVKAMEQIADVADEKRGHPGAQQTPGIQIVIVHRQEPAEAPAEPREVFPVRRDLGIITP